MVDSLNKDKERYAHETEEIQKEANAKEKESDHEEQRAVWLDLGEGFLELGLVLSSLYFLSKRKFFPIFGVTAAVIGTVLGVLGFIT